MSITPEMAEKHRNDPAVVCCLTQEGTVISPGDLEDPSILPDLEESGLLKLPLPYCMITIVARLESFNPS